VYKVSGGDRAETGPSPQALTLPRTGTYLILGLVALYFGGGWVVGGATGLATALGVDDALIGLTVIAVGTSTPEIFTSAVAAYRNQADLAIGNAVGSNIFNLLLVLGSTAAIVELPFEVISNTDLAMVIAASALLILALAASRANTVRRSHGAVFVVLYGVYVWYAIVRG
jgi:cation:H+ antiporter